MEAFDPHALKHNVVMDKANRQLQVFIHLLDHIKNSPMHDCCIAVLGEWYPK